MSEIKAPTAEREQETEKQNPPKEAAKENSAGKKDITDIENEAEETGNSRQRFFSQMEVNRIVKREIERALKNSKLPELEAAQAKVTELESQVKRNELRSLVTEAAAKAGAKSAGLLFRAVEEKIELGGDGKPANLDEILKEARRDYPELFRKDSTGHADGGAGQQNNPRLSMNELLRRGRE